MAKKPTVTTLQSGFNSTDVLNQNFEALRDAFDNTLSLDGSIPNAMEGDFDLNGYSIANAGGILINGQDVISLLNTSTSSAASSAAQALNSSNSASASEDAAAASAADAATDAASAATSWGYFSPYTDEIQVIADDLIAGSFEAGSIYDFGSITNPAAGQSGSPDGFIVTVYENLDNIASLATIDADISTVANSAGDVVNVGNSISNVNVVAGNIANVNTVGTISTDVTFVANNTDNIATVGGIASDVITVASISADVTTVATNDTNVSTVATNVADVNTVATNISDVGVVSTNIAAINSANTNMAHIQAAPAAATAAATSETNAATSETNAATSETNAATSATNAATSETNAASSAVAASNSQVAAAASAASAANVYDTFDDRYLGTHASDPTVDNDGQPLVQGSLFFNSTANEMRVYDGGNWIAASSAGGASLLTYHYTATAGQTSFSGADDNANSLSYTISNIIVVLNGVVLEEGTDFTATDGTSVVLSAGATVSDELNVFAFKSFTTADMVSATNGGTFSNDITVLGDVTATSFIGDGSALTGLPAGYTNADVDTHLNTSTAAAGEVLQWNGSDYAWGAGIPTGLISMWSGAIGSIPTGWALCDGTNGTPNLVDRFVVAAGGSLTVGATGGQNSTTLSTANLPAHTHSFSASTNSQGNHSHSGSTNTTGNHSHTVYSRKDSYGSGDGLTGADTNGNDEQVYTGKTGGITNTTGNHSHSFSTNTTGAHTHTVSGTTGSEGSGSSFDNRPEYYALAYIMKT